MFQRILNALALLNQRLSSRAKLLIIGLIAGVLTLGIISIWLNRGSSVTTIKPQDSQLLSTIRDQIEKLGNPFYLTKDSILNKYPFNITNRVSDDVYLVEVNTSMLRDSAFDEFFNNDSQLKDCLANTPLEHVGTYQIFFDVKTSLSTNPCQRMTNFNKISLNGTEYWFMEENDQYWVQIPSTNKLTKITRSLSSLPPYRKLTKIGPNKFLSTFKDEEKINIDYTTFEIFGDFTSRTTTGSLNFNFLDKPLALGFEGGVTASQVLPEIYPINANLVLNKSITSTEAIFTIANINSITTPTLLETQLKFKELNSIFTTCAPTKESCFVFNPGIKSLTKIDNLAKPTELKPTLDITLTELASSLKLTFEKDKLFRYNEDSDELLFFYQGKWKSVYRF